jgi:probable HAF family extracellular repeat protein
MFGTAAGQPYLYGNGVTTPVAGLAQGSSVVGVNPAGQTTGNLPDGHAFLDNNGIVVDLGTLGGTSSNAAALNASGNVVGDAQSSNGSYSAFLYDGTMKSLGTLGGASSFAAAINNAGQVVGGSETATGVQHAFVYSNGTMQDLGTLGGPTSSALAINNAGQIAGSSQLANGLTHAFLISGGQMIDLGSLGNSSYGFGLNASGAVVGMAYLPNGNNGVSNRAFLSLNGGPIVDLNSLVANASGWTLTTATGISDSGQIVGIGTVNGTPHGFLLVPVPEPSSVVVVGMASLALVMRRARVSRKTA